jgi:hypothetical protein
MVGKARHNCNPTYVVSALPPPPRRHDMISGGHSVERKWVQGCHTLYSVIYIGNRLTNPISINTECKRYGQTIRSYVTLVYVHLVTLIMKCRPLSTSCLPPTGEKRRLRMPFGGRPTRVKRFRNSPTDRQSDPICAAKKHNRL